MSIRPTLLSALPKRPLSAPLRRTSPVPSSRPYSSSSRPLAQLTPAEEQAAKSLDWPTYLSLRKSQRIYGLVASVPTTFIGFTAGAGYFATIESDPTDLILGLEPVYAYAAATLGCVGLGWLAGPVVGSAVWRLVHRRVAKAVEAKDKDFFAHISRKRADPTRASVSNPPPDYYAEKVGSLTGYRHWLRDQNVFMRKAAFGEGADKVV